MYCFCKNKTNKHILRNKLFGGGKKTSPIVFGARFWPKKLPPKLEKKGLVISARSEMHNLVEMIELKDHPWFVACQFHPEFTSKPKKGHPLFNDFIKTAVKLKK